jgi:hypothetical protein
MIPVMLNQIQRCSNIEVVHGSGGGVPRNLMDKCQLVTRHIPCIDLDLPLECAKPWASNDQEVLP